MYFLLFIEFVISKIHFINQSFFFSEIETDENIIVPKHCFIVGYPCAKNSSFTGGKFTLFKPLRKMHEYEYDIERGIELLSLENLSLNSSTVNTSKELENVKSLDDRVLDSITYPDFSSQAVGIAIGCILLSLQYKLFN